MQGLRLGVNHKGNALYKHQNSSSINDTAALRGTRRKHLNWGLFWALGVCSGPASLHGCYSLLSSFSSRSFIVGIPWDLVIFFPLFSVHTCPLGGLIHLHEVISKFLFSVQNLWWITLIHKTDDVTSLKVNSFSITSNFSHLLSSHLTEWHLWTLSCWGQKSWSHPWLLSCHTSNPSRDSIVITLKINQESNQ